MKNKNLFIVFSQEHYNPLGLIRSLGESNIYPIAIIKRGNFKFASKSKYIAKLHLVDTIEEGYELLLKYYKKRKNKPFILTTDDQITSFLDLHYDDIKEYFNFFNAGKTGRITKFMNKNNIISLAKKHGINTIKSWMVKTGEIPENIEYPVVTKAIISTIEDWKKDAFICNNDYELLDAFNKIKSKKIIIQQYIDKKNEMAINGFSIDHGKETFFSIAINYNSIIDNRYGNYMTVMKTYNQEIEKKVSNMLKEIGYEGVMEAEFLVGQDDELYFLEINFRNSTWNYASHKAGMNLNLLWSISTINNKINKSFKVEFKNFTSMVEFEDFYDRVITKKISICKWFRQLRKCKCIYYFNRKDMGPIYSKFFHKFKIKRKLK